MRYIISVLLTLTVFFAAQPLFAADKTSAEARKVLDKAAAKVNINKGASASFTISNGNSGSRSGSITIKGNKFYARTQDATMWYNGKTQWVYNSKTDEVNVSSPKAAQQQSMNPYTFLNLYKKGYDMTLTKAASGKEVHLVGKGKAISEMYILVDNSFVIKQVKMLQKGKWIVINISNFKQTSVSDAVFTFNKKDFPKAEIIDLR